MTNGDVPESRDLRSSRAVEIKMSAHLLAIA
jgi:hypothetical protein